MSSAQIPLLIPSYNRPGAPLIELAQRCLKKDYPWWAFVRKSQVQDYLDAGAKRSQLVAMPDHKAGNVGDTRNYLLRWAHAEGYSHIFDWDDDVFRFGRKLEDGTRHESFKSSGNVDPWFDGPGYWEEVSRISQEVFDLYPGTVAGSVQNQRWANSLTVQVQCGKTPRRTKIMHVDRIIDNYLTVPKEFRLHGDDIGCAAMYLENDWQVFTICNLVYDFVSETDPKLPSTLRDRDEDKNKKIHAQEYKDLQKYAIRDYLRVTKAYDDGSYMYGDIDWRKFRKLTGHTSYQHVFSPVMDRVPLSSIPCTITE